LHHAYPSLRYWSCGGVRRVAYHRWIPKFLKERAMRQRTTQQKSLFEVLEAARAVQLPAEVQLEVAQLLRQWIHALAKAICQEGADEQD
jgi:hypothetical protein